MENISGRLVGMERLIYFDHNSTAPYCPSVLQYLQTTAIEDWYNPSSVYPQSQVLNQKIRECRKFIADHLNCSSKHFIFYKWSNQNPLTQFYR